MASTAPGVRVLPVRVLGKCGGRDSDIIAGMRWAAGLSVPGVPANPHPARVINLSLGGEGSCSAAYRDAVDEITAAGTVIVAAAGNTSGHAVATPASCPGVIAVAGLRHVGTKVGFSVAGRRSGDQRARRQLRQRRGRHAVPVPDPHAPPIRARRCRPRRRIPTASTPRSERASRRPSWPGSPPSPCPLDPTLTPAQVKELLQRTARPFPTPGSIASSSAAPECTPPQLTLGGRPVDQLECYCTTTTCGAGMLDAAAALAAAEASRSR